MMLSIIVPCWIDRHQKTEDIVHMDLDFLPLKTYANIVEGNALRINWEEVIPKDKLNYIMGNPNLVNSFNLYKVVAEASSPESLLSELADRIKPLPNDMKKVKADTSDIDNIEDGIYTNYLHYFVENNFFRKSI